MDQRVPCLLLPVRKAWPTAAGCLLTTPALHHFLPRPAMQSATQASNLCNPPICPLRLEGLLKNAGLLRHVAAEGFLHCVLFCTSAPPAETWEFEAKYCTFAVPISGSGRQNSSQTLSSLVGIRLWDYFNIFYLICCLAKQTKVPIYSLGATM